MAAITATNQTSTLANSILQKFDANHDGSLSSDEFGTFLTQLVGSVTTQQSPTATGAANLSTLFQSVSTPGAARLGLGENAASDGGTLGDASPKGVKGFEIAQSPAETTPNSTAPLTPNSSEPTPAAARTRVGNMAGFDDTKLRDESHISFKYQIGRILQYYANTPEGLRQALPEIQKLVPGTKIIGTNGDKLDFGDYQDPKSGRIGVVDVLLSAGLGGRGWAWQPVS